MSGLDDEQRMCLRRIGVVRSSLTDRAHAPRQGMHGAPDAWIQLDADVADGATDIGVGDALVVLTWLHLGDRDALRARANPEIGRPERGVFSTRSPSRPNPIGLHPVTVKARDGLRLLVGPLEAIDGTPVVDIKVQLRRS